MSELKVRRHGYTHTELSSVSRSFPTKHGETRLVLVIEQATRETWGPDGADPVERQRDDDPPRLSIRPSHGWGGLTRAECVWLEKAIPELWDEWERRVGVNK